MSIERISFWRDLAERLARQAQQTAVPLLVALAAAAPARDRIGGVLLATAAAIGGALVLTTVTTLTGLTVDRSAPVAAQIVERVLKASAGVLAGALPVEVAGWAAVDWTNMGWAAAVAALVALVAGEAAPPSGRGASRLAA